jgi:tyrosyl-tRNA synthetase
LVQIGSSSSNSEARRLISQGALKVNGNKIDTFKIADIRDGDVIQVGKLKYIKIRIKG